MKPICKFVCLKMDPPARFSATSIQTMIIFFDCQGCPISGIKTQIQTYNWMVHATYFKCDLGDGKNYLYCPFSHIHEYQQHVVYWKINVYQHVPTLMFQCCPDTATPRRSKESGAGNDVIAAGRPGWIGISAQEAINKCHKDEGIPGR